MKMIKANLGPLPTFRDVPTPLLKVLAIILGLVISLLLLGVGIIKLGFSYRQCLGQI